MGKIELDHTGSGGGVTLSSDGTSLLLGGSAVGGGADLYAANESSPVAQPSAVGANAIAIGQNTDAGTSASHINAIAIGGSNTASQPITASNTHAVAIGTSYSGPVTASGDGAMAIGTGGTVANSTGALALGRLAEANAARAIALGESRAGGSDSFAAAIDNNTSSYGATGANSIAMGYQSKSTGNYAVAIGSAQATGSDYGVSIGYNARSSNHSTVAIGREAGLLGSGSSSVSIGHEASSSGGNSLAIGRLVKANASNSTAIGAYASVGGIIGKYAFANDYINNAGDAQQGKYVLHVSTTNATDTALTSTGTAASSNNQLNLQNNSAYAFHGTIVARESAGSGTECAAWKVEGLIRREGSAGTTVLVNSATTVLNNAPSWGMALSADTTNGALAITVTGAAKTIRWVATIETSELIHA